jgi:signal transduction histidine kinase/DNA-binding response OmpR family regulator
LSFSIIGKGQVNIDSLEHLLKSANDTGKISILNKLGDAFITIDYKKAFDYTSQALELSTEKKYTQGEADAQKNLGYIYLTYAEYPKAIEHSNIAYKLYTSLKSHENKGFVLNMLGVTYETIGVYDKALHYFLQAMKIYEQYGIEKRMASVYSNISLIYGYQNRQELSREYIRKALRFDKKNHDEVGIAIDYTNIANSYFSEKQYKKVLLYYDSIIPILKKNQDFVTLGNAYGLFGGNYYYLNNKEKAIELYLLSIETLEKVNDVREILNSYNSLAKLFIEKGDLKKATEWGNKALTLACKIKRNYSYASVYKTLTLLSKDKGDYKQALEYQDKYLQYNDSLKKNELSQKLLNMQTLYDTEAKEQQITSLNKENELKSNRLSKQQWIITLVVISLTFSLLFLLILLNRYRIKQNANKALELKNKEIEWQKQQIIEINNKLSEQASKLKKLDEVKSRFFTNISHEFRTPLTLITSPLEVFISQTADEKLKLDYIMMLGQAKKLLTLVNQLLELSKLEKGLMRLVLSKDDLNTFIRTLTSSYASLAEELKVELTFEGINSPLNIWFDKDKVEKIVTNMITNALKFTNSQGKISVVMRKVPANEQIVEIVISDTGTGIDTEHLKYIFDPFYQASQSVNKKFQGTGIGLALVKELLNLHHGSISVNSKPGKGSEFIVQLPVDKSAYKEDEFIEAETEPKLTPLQLHSEIPITPDEKIESEPLVVKENPIILLVDDNEDMRKYIMRNISNEYQVTEATDGNEGIEKAKEHTPDIILADIMMPGMDGLEMVKILKTDVRTSHIPIVFLTAKASDENKIEGLETQADDYITKPFNFKELTLRIRNLIFNRQKLREKFAKSISITPSEIASNSVDEQFLQKALQIIETHIDDTEYNAEKFCQDMGMSRSNLHRKLIALTNQPATEFIRSIRLKRAAQLLSNHSASVSEIAFKTGFGNLSYFTKCFKEQFGITPSEYPLSKKDKVAES